MRTILHCLLICTVILISCNNNFELSNARKAILEQNTKRICALKNGDIDTLVDIYTDDAIILPPGDTVQKGKDEIKMFFEHIPPAGEIIDGSIISNEIKGVGDTLYEIGEYHLTIKPFDSDATHTKLIKYLSIWKHQSNGSWKMYAECWNHDRLQADNIF